MQNIKEKEKFQLIKNEIEKDLVYSRFVDIHYLNKYLNKYDIIAEEVDESRLLGDYVLIARINENWGYVYIYYTKGFNGIFITEIKVSEN